MKKNKYIDFMIKELYAFRSNFYKNVDILKDTINLNYGDVKYDIRYDLERIDMIKNRVMEMLNEMVAHIILRKD